jgi:nicotinamidase-related amidase
MLSIKIPDSKRKKALILIDLQPIFLNNKNSYVLKNMENLFKNEEYFMYIKATFSAPKGSIWDKQLGWIVEENKDTDVFPARILELLKDKNCINVKKETKSIFKGTPDILPILKENGIEEINIIGVDTNDCILATAYESFDYGFFTYIIEECVQSSEGEEIHEAGLKVLRHVNLTNNSCIEKIGFKEI